MGGSKVFEGGVAPAARPVFGDFGAIGGVGTGRPDFAASVPDGGYAWWYVDALSDDGARGLTIIAMVGSVFSPWYAWARRRGAAPAENHCAMNVALYGTGGKRWAMTERGAASVSRDAGGLAIGPSAMSWDGSVLTVRIEETTAPLPSRLRGTVRLWPTGIARQVVALDGTGGRHGWSPVAPTARVEVVFTHPARSWQGHGYFDMNWGARPLEADFAHWHWSRAMLRDGTAVLYEVTRRDGTRQCTALRYARDGSCTHFVPPPEVPLASTFWRLRRDTRADRGGTARVVSTFEDAPFYARSQLATRVLGEDCMAMHETLSLDRFDTPWMRLMLPFRAPKAS
jgi:carotenoid 1,2-hydratase